MERNRKKMNAQGASLPVTVKAVCALLCLSAALQAQEDSAAGPEPGTVQVNSADRQEYAWVPPGQFMMGCVPGDDECDEDESPRHGVTISSGLWMGRTEVTVEAYERFTEATEFSMPPPPEFNPDWKDKDHPVVRVQWEQARAFCEWAGGRLPTEAEFEYATRAGYDGLKYPWGASVTHEDANYRGTAGHDQWANTAPVGSFPPSRYGLHDLSGNVWEWASDWYHERYYQLAPLSDPQGHPKRVERVLRGGSWFTVPRVLRASDRYKYVPVAMDNSVGFRCVLPPLP